MRVSTRGREQGERKGGCVVYSAWPISIALRSLRHNQLFLLPALWHLSLYCQKIGPKCKTKLMSFQLFLSKRKELSSIELTWGSNISLRLGKIYVYFYIVALVAQTPHISHTQKSSIIQDVTLSTVGVQTLAQCRKSTHRVISTQRQSYGCKWVPLYFQS